MRLDHYPLGCSDVVNNIWSSFSINIVPGVEWQLPLLQLNYLTHKYFISQLHRFVFFWFKDLKIQRKNLSLRDITIGPFNQTLRLPPGYCTCMLVGQQGKEMSLCCEIHPDDQDGWKGGTS